MSAPQVPQRPSRSKHSPAKPDSASNIPQVPPRPAKRFDRSASRDRAAATRSPLNDSPFDSSHQRLKEANLASTHHDSATHIARPPSVSSLPMIGQEGSEYASLDSSLNNKNVSNQPISSPTETKSVASDLPLHAPKASVSPVASKNRIATVTRTDSSKAAIAGVGKPSTEYAELDRQTQPPIATLARTSSAVSDERSGSARPESIDEHDYEQGIPEIGRQAPLIPFAGDVQAPTPGPGSTPHSAGIGFFNDGSHSGANEGHRRSVHGFHAPPGSYGLHGHGVGPHDKFERDWYQRHPDELAKEESGAYGPALSDRPEWAMSSDELNRLVRDSASRGPGMGTKSGMIGTPSETIAYEASQEYSSKLNSPASTPTLGPKSRFSRPGSQTHADSPLRKEFSISDVKNDTALDDETDDDQHTYIRPPSRRADKYGGAGYDPPTVDLGPHGGNTDEQGGWIDEQGRGTPILASDEIAKNPAAEYMQPAISPSRELTEDEYFAPADSDQPTPLTPSQSRSRSRGSRPRSLHAQHGRFASHDYETTGTPLEEIEEYEPLFDEDDDDSKRKPLNHADRLRRPNLAHRFPSKDVWEDTPTSLQLQTTVETPQEPATVTSPENSRGAAAAAFEHPEKEQARRGEITESERSDFLSDASMGFAKPKFGAHLHGEMRGRPGLQHRFPSRDVWEDTPDSLRLETTVGEVNEAKKSSATSPPERPSVPARPVRSKAVGAGEPQGQDQPRIPASSTLQGRQGPSAAKDVTPPLSETKSNEISPTDRKAPSIPERPKPQVPVRPAARSPPQQQQQQQQQQQDESTPRAKPAVPARPQPGSSKFASIRAGFMSDLNSRLQGGPKDPPKPEQPKSNEDATPLSDARKARARGPARRRPAVSPSPLATEVPQVASWSISEPTTVWRIDSDGDGKVHVPQKPRPSAALPTAQDLDEEPTASPLARNTAGESLQPRSVTPKLASGALAHPGSREMDARARDEEETTKRGLRDFEAQRIGHEGDMPEPVVDDSNTPRPQTQTKADKPPADDAEARSAQGAPLSPQNKSADPSAPSTHAKDMLPRTSHPTIPKSELPAPDRAEALTAAGENTTAVPDPSQKQTLQPSDAAPMSPVATKNTAPMEMVLDDGGDDDGENVEDQTKEEGVDVQPLGMSVSSAEKQMAETVERGEKTNERGEDEGKSSASAGGGVAI